jgi:NAD(P)-dependent dehydrogenase (short-subunit alcohol dehydrogenase family)
LLVNLRAEKLFSLAGKTVVLTGASGYLGRNFSRALLENGARVVAMGRSDRLISEASNWQREFGKDRVTAHQMDMYDIGKLGALLDAIAKDEPQIDVIINNAHELGLKTGFNTIAGSLENASFDQWNRHFLGGIYCPALIIQKLGIKMKEAKRGSIINISTMYALVAPNPALYEGTDMLNPPGYSASKAALLSFTRYLASFWGRHGIRANAVLPGPFSNIEDNGSNCVSQNDPFLDRLKSRTCLRRIGHPTELVGCLLYLASDASTYTTGQAFVIDGGWTVT